MKTTKILTLALASVLTIACSSNDTMTTEEKTAAYNDFISKEKLTQVDLIRSFNLRGWSSLGEQHMIITASANRPYLITLKHDCYDLDFSQTIKVHSHNRMLRANFDYITMVPDPIKKKCFIDTIHELTKAQKQMLKEIGKPTNSSKSETEVQQIKVS